MKAQPATDAGVLLQGLDVALGAVLSDAMTHAQVDPGAAVGTNVYGLIFLAYQILTRAAFQPDGRTPTEEVTLTAIRESADTTEQSIRKTRENLDAMAERVVTKLSALGDPRQ